MAAEKHWTQWHAAYEDPNSSLSHRLAVVQRRLGEALDRAAVGPIRLVSTCAGRGRDVIEVVADHSRRADVTARLVELDPDLVADARALAAQCGLDRIEVVQGDAADTSRYVGAVPADIVMVCGVFGNITPHDIEATIRALPQLCAPEATLIWTRHRLVPDLTPTIRSWFHQAGFEELWFDTEPGFSFGVGTNRLVAEPPPLQPERRLFTFIGDGGAAQL